MSTKSITQWQKLYPDAIKITAKANALLTNKELLIAAYGDSYHEGKVLQDTSHATWTPRGGVKATINAIVSKQAKTDIK